MIEMAALRCVFFPLSLFLCAFSLFGTERGTYHHYFTLRGDAVLWRRSNGFQRFNQRLVELAKKTPKEGNTAVIQSLPNGVESSQLLHRMYEDLGVRIGIDVVSDRRVTWSASYTGFLHWEGREQLERSGKLSLPFPSHSISSYYQGADRVNALYSSNFYSVDLTHWRHVTPRYVDAVAISWTAGLQFFSLNERINLNFTKKEVTNPYHLETRSRSFGPFFGFHFECNPHAYITCGVTGNIGGLVSQSDRKIAMLSINQGATVQGYGSRIASPAYFVHVHPFIDIHLIKFFNCLIGYDVLYLDRVAVADRQLVTQVKAKEKPNCKGHVILCGFFAGIQLNF